MTVSSKDVKPFIERRKEEYLANLEAYWNRSWWSDQSRSKLEYLRVQFVSQGALHTVLGLVLYLVGIPPVVSVPVAVIMLVLSVFAYASPTKFVRTYGKIKWSVGHSAYKKRILKRILERHAALETSLARAEAACAQPLHEMDRLVANSTLAAVDQTFDDLYQLEVGSKSAPILRDKDRYEQADMEIKGSINSLREELGLRE